MDRYPTYDRIDAETGAVRKIRTYRSDPITQRFGVTADGVTVGEGFSSADDAVNRGIDFCRDGR